MTVPGAGVTGTSLPTAGSDRVGALGTARVRTDLLLGARLAVGGGRASAVRLLLISVAVGMCVTLLLIAASIGPAQRARAERAAGMTPATLAIEPEATPVLEVHTTALRSGDLTVVGVDLAALDPSAPPPPGVARLPGPGELVLSPALARLLATPQGEGLRPRLAGPVVGTIGDAGLVDPQDLHFYRGIEPSTRPLSTANQASGWGVVAYSDPLGSLTVTLLVAGTTILLVPLLLLVAMSTRLGGVARDRRLAAIRLVGASRAQMRQLAAGEALVAAVLGLVLGAGGFLVARSAARWLSLDGRTFFPSDVVPDPWLALVVLVSVPVLSVGAALGALHAVVVGPLGVSRSDRTSPRRLRWRLLVVAAAAVAIALSSRLTTSSRTLVASITLAMICVPVVVPYLVERVSKWLPTGPPAWQLAVRRLGLDAGTPGRISASIAVVLAGAVALLPLLGYASGQVDEATVSRSGAGYLRLEDVGPDAFDGVPRLITGAVPQAAPVGAWVVATMSDEGGTGGPVQIAGCSTVLAMTAAGQCRDGDVFFVGPPLDSGAVPAGGTQVRLSVDVTGTVAWRVPSTVVSVALRPEGFVIGGLVLTPGALTGQSAALLDAPGQMQVQVNAFGAATLSPADLDRIRNALASAGLRITYDYLGPTTSVSRFGQVMATVRVGLVVGGGLLVLLAALGLVVTVVEQITERRRALTLAVAMGIPRAVLGRSLLIGAVIPAVIAFAVADVVGLLIPLAIEPLLGATLGTHPAGVAALTGAGLALVVLVTATVLPILRGLTRPESLRTE